ncbi:hypothetical protein HUJ04_000670 [Dendroctonus ponderosae]|nr:hypothetical protein HUJ04_000670 [Dendroctonus ponderosae]KAH1018843.1 hypothetical protein HUJ05_006534 [Dendroctonus ponderosae]
MHFEKLNIELMFGDWGEGKSVTPKIGKNNAEDSSDLLSRPSDDMQNSNYLFYSVKELVDCSYTWIIRKEYYEITIKCLQTWKVLEKKLIC